MRQLRGLVYLAWLTTRRQIFAKKSLLVAGLLGTLCLVIILYVRKHHPGPDAAPEQLNEEIVDFIERIIMGVYVSFLLPIVMVVYATAAFGEERELRTLAYLLIRPLSRPRVYLAKAIGIVPVILFWGLAGFGLICLVGGDLGQPAWQLFWPAITSACLAYSVLFLLFGATFARPAVIAIVYSFFVESMLGNMPGTIKRIAISYYTQCMIFDAGSDLGLKASSREQFLPISGEAAWQVLSVSTFLLLLLGCWIFHRKEYRDLT